MKYYCPNCKWEGDKPKKYKKGSILLEIFLWFCYLFPGFIYSIWRLSTKYRGCPKCEYQFIVKK